MKPLDEEEEEEFKVFYYINNSVLKYDYYGLFVVLRLLILDSQALKLTLGS